MIIDSTMMKNAGNNGDWNQCSGWLDEGDEQNYFVAEHGRLFFLKLVEIEKIYWREGK